MSSAQDEWQYWADQATLLSRTQLTTIQGSATKWAQLMAALVGVFGTVAFAGGLTTIDKLDSPWAGYAKVLTSAAVVAAVVATAVLAYAAGGLLPVRHPTLNGQLLRQANQLASGQELTALKVGRISAITAGGLVIAGSGLVLWAPTSPPSATALVVVHNGGAVCGTPTAKGGMLAVGSIPISPGDAVVPVGHCP